LGIVYRGKREGREGVGREGKGRDGCELEGVKGRLSGERGGRDRLGYLSRDPEFLVTPLCFDNLRRIVIFSVV